MFSSSALASWASTEGDVNLDNPRFSVVICTYNRPHAEYVQRAVRSVLLQTFDDWELLVVNDGDTKNSKLYQRLLLAYRDDQRIRYYELPKHLGISGARNAGIKEARGQYLVFLDDDDRLLPGALARLWAAIERHDYPEMVYGDALYENMAYRYLFSCIPLKRGEALRFPFSAKRLKEYNYLICSAVAVAKRAVGDGFWEDLWADGLCGPEDWEMWLRVARDGGRIVGDPHVVLMRRADFVEGTPTEPQSAIAARTGKKEQGEAMIRARYADWEPVS